MKNLYPLFLLSFLCFSCQKDKSKIQVEEKVTKIKSFGNDSFIYDQEGKLKFITRLLPTLPSSPPLESRSSFEYQSDGKASFFSAEGLYGMSGVNSLSHKYYDYSYPTADQTIIKFSKGLDRLSVGNFSSTFKLTNTNGLLTLIEVFFTDIATNRYDLPTDRIEISYLGKNPSVIAKYKYLGVAPDYKVKGWSLVEKYYDFTYDKFTNPLRVVFNGKPNFCFIDVQDPDDFSFVNLYSISTNNTLSAKVKYYNYDGLFIADGAISYEPRYDANNNMINYYCINEKFAPLSRTFTQGMLITY